MQDIGGCRVVLQDIEKLVALVEKYKRSNLDHKLVRIKDYINEPKESDYRGVHLIYKYKSRKKKEFDGLYIEIQARTKLQHLWATAVETVGAMTSHALKSNIGSEDWLRFFSLMGDVLAKQEGSPRVPNSPNSESELLEKLRALVTKLKVELTLAAYSLIPESTATLHARYYLLDVNWQRTNIVNNNDVLIYL